MPQQEVKKDRVKIDAPIDNIVELVRGAFEGPSEVGSTVPTTASYDTPQGPVQPTAIENLKGMLDKPPLMADYKPSGLRKFGAALAGGLTGAAGGPKVGMEVASNILDQPYKEEYQDWLTKTGALEKGANIDINRLRAERSGYAGLASLKRAEDASNVDLQGDLATVRDQAKTTNDQKDYQFYLKYTDDPDPVSFEQFIKDKKAGVERNTSIHRSVKDAREQNLAMTDREGNSIDLNKLPDNMEYRMMLGGPNGPYWVEDTQNTRATTMGGIRYITPALTPTAPIVSGVANPPRNTTREVRSTDALTGRQMFEKQYSSTAQDTPGAFPFPVKAPVYRPNSQNQLPVVTSPIQTNVPITQPAQPNIPIQSNTTTTRGSRPAVGFDTASMNAFRKYTIPASTALANIFGDPKTGVKGLDSYADIANDPKAMERVGTYMRFLLDNITSAGGGGEEVGANFGPVGANISTGGLWTFLKNSTPLTRWMTQAQMGVIQKAANDLTDREDEFVAKAIAAAGDVAGLRALTQGGAYKWSVDRLKAELPIPGYGIKSGESGSRSFYNKLVSMIGAAQAGIEGAKIPDELMTPYSLDFIRNKVKEYNEYGTGIKKLAPRRNITFERIK